MNRQLSRYAALLLIGFWFALPGAGCGQKPAADPTEPQTFEYLPQATNVTAALDQKDYEAALGAWVKLRESISTEQQREDYSKLTRHMRGRLAEASADDPKAAEALNVLLVSTLGR